MDTNTGRRPFYRSLYLQVIVAIVLGVLMGYFYPSAGEAMKPLGDGFIKLIKMIIAPIIFCTVVVGIAGMEDMKKVGKTGGLALLYFEIVSSIALVVGLVVINIVKPGVGMNIDAASLDTKGIAAYTKPGQMASTTDFLLNIIPSTVVDAFAKGEILQVLFIAVLFGFALHRFGGRGTLVFDFIEKLSHVLFGIVGTIMKVAPIGAFGAMAFTIGKYGVGSLVSLGALMATFYATCLFFIFVVLGLIARFHGFSIWRFIRYIKEEALPSGQRLTAVRARAPASLLGVFGGAGGRYITDELRRGAWLERGAQRGLEPTADDAQRQREEARERCGACGGGSRSEAEG